MIIEWPCKILVGLWNQKKDLIAYKIVLMLGQLMVF